MRRQEEGEPIDTFITALYSLAEHCGYGDLHDEVIRDRIVVGIRNGTLSEKLQLDSGLTLETAVAQVHQAEAFKQQQPLLRGGGAKQDIPVGAVQRAKKKARADRTVVPLPQNSLAAAQLAPGVAKSLPMIVSIALLKRLYAGSVTRRGTFGQCADPQ